MIKNKNKKGREGERERYIFVMTVFLPLQAFSDVSVVTRHDNRSSPRTLKCSDISCSVIKDNRPRSTPPPLSHALRVVQMYDVVINAN